MNSEFGILYLIPCPISDETAPWDVLPAANRAVMDALDYFIVENTRTARRFLSKAGIARPIGELEFRELNEHTAAGREIEELIAPLLEGRSAGVISEAGVPGVADPGAPVVGACHRRGIRVVPLVGPSSIILAVMASGLNGQSFAFNGYLPVKPPERTRAIRFFERRALSEGQSQLFIEAPYRVVDKTDPSNPVVTDEVVYLTADEEDNFVVAQANEQLDEEGHFVHNNVSGRFREETSEFQKKKIDLIDVSPKMVFSVATSMIPFLQNDDANRALMGSNRRYRF